MTMSSKFLKRIKTVLKSCMLILFSFGMILSSMPIRGANNHQVTTSFPFDGWHASWGTGLPAFISINGEAAFCIEPGHIVQTGTNNEIPFSNIIVNGKAITQKQAARLAYIAYFGYRVNPLDDNYVLTQNLIWDELGGRPASSAGLYIHDTKYPDAASQQAWKDAVMDQVNRMEIKPSFDGEKISLNPGETITLTDTNNVLSSFTVTSNGKLNVSQNENRLTITAPADMAGVSETLSFTKNLPASALGTLFAVRGDDGTQGISTLKIEDPVRAELEIAINDYGSLKIIKKNDLGEVIPNTKFKLSYHSDMSDPIGTYTTGNDGSVTISKLLPQTIYFQEVEAPQALILNSTIKSVTVKSSTTVTYIQINKRKTGNVILEKLAKEDNHLKLKGAVYMLCTSDGAILKDNLVTDSAGQIKVNNLSWGDYYFIEKTAPDGWKLSKEKIFFSINADTVNTTQTLQAFDQLNEAYTITVTKRILVDELWWEHGEPTFLFKISGLDVANQIHTYFESCTFTKEYVEAYMQNGYVEISMTFTDLPKGSYTVSELKTSRYAIQDIINITNGIRMGSLVNFSLSSKNPHGETTFVNEKTNDAYDSHTDVKINEIRFK